MVANERRQYPQVTQSILDGFNIVERSLNLLRDNPEKWVLIIDQDLGGDPQTFI